MECFGGGEGKESPVKHEARGSEGGGPARARGGDWRGRTGRGGQHGPRRGGARAKKDRAEGNSTGALCTGFALV